MAVARLRPLLVAAVALLAAGALAACGQEETITSADTEGPYLDVGPLQYQVQISRQMNPTDGEDRDYFVGVPNAQGQLTPDETWFGVFIKAWNGTGHPQPAANHFEIVDTVGKKYQPVAIGNDNIFAYRPVMIPPNSTLPAQNSLAQQAPIGGSLLLFKVTNESLANRPLVLHIESADRSATAEVDLDV